MDKHGKKMIAPIVVTVVVLLYYAVFFSVLISSIRSTVFKVLLATVPILIGGALIAVCIQRIKEIKGGEEDDLGQY